MKKKFLLVTSILLMFSACTINRPQETQRKITVNGSGSVTVDSVILTFSVKNKDSEQSAAKNTNLNLSSKIQDTLKASEIDTKDISCSEIKIDQEVARKGEWVKNEEGIWVQKDIYSYTASNTIKVTVSDVSIAKTIKDIILKTGGNSVTLDSAVYTTGDTALCMRQARTQAVQNAQDSANFLAGASGCRVGKVLEIQEGKIENTTVNAAGLLSSLLPGATTAVTDGTVSIKTNITITYSIVD